MKKLLLSTLLAANGVAFAASFVVKDIRVDGVLPSTEAAIIAALPVKVGQTATDNDVANVVRQLFVQNQFEDVRATREGNTLVIKVTERPVINRVDISGNSAVPKDPLEQNLKANLISKGEMFNAQRLAAFRDSLLEHYHSIGRYNAKVEAKTTRNENGGMDIALEISEGDVAKVKTIAFEGNHAFSRNVLMKQLDIQPDVAWWNIFQSSKFEQAAYGNDIDNLRDFYLNRGYAKFTLLGTDIQFSEDKKEVSLTYKISEGSPYHISAIQIVGDTGKQDAALKGVLANVEAGQLFRKSDLSQIEEEIKAILGSAGYSTAKVDLYPVFDDENKTVRINVIVEARQRMYVRKIRFEGNEVTADSTLRREMRQQEGAWLSTQSADLGKLRLERTGFYESVELNYEPVAHAFDQVDLVYKIRERNTGSISFGVGFGSESGISYQFGVKQDNFLGMGSSIGLNGTRNDYGTSVSLSYTEPYFTKDGVSLGGNIFYEDYDNSKNDTVANYHRRTYGVSGTLSFPVDEYNAYYLGLGYTHDNIKNAQREFNREIYATSMRYTIDPNSNYYPKMKADDFDFSFGWNYNSLNRGYFPTKGVSASLGGRITIPGSDNQFYKLSADFRHYYPLQRDHKWVISTKASLSFAEGFKNKALPFYQNHTLGGIGSLRGFAYGGIGPLAIYRDSAGQFSQAGVNGDIVGGNAIATASLELITPTPFVSEKYQHNVRTSLFIDAGTIWNTKWQKTSTLNDVSYDFSSMANFKDHKRIRASAGVAFQWHSPIGPLIFSYAKPIKKYAYDEVERFQFSIGGTF